MVVKSMKPLLELTPGGLVSQLLRLRNSMLEMTEVRDQNLKGMRLLNFTCSSQILIKELVPLTDYFESGNPALDPKLLLGDAKNIYDLCKKTGILVTFQRIDEWGGRVGLDMIANLHVPSSY